jgi:serine protease
VLLWVPGYPFQAGLATGGGTMSRIGLRFVAIASVVLAFTAAASAAPSPSPASYLPHVVIVKFRTPIDAGIERSPGLLSLIPAGLSGARAILRRPGAIPVAGGLERLYEVPVLDGDIPVLAARLSRLPEVEYAEPRYLYQVVGASEGQGVMAVPNDPRYATDQQYLTPLNVQNAWNIVKGETGSPVVCVVDGGTNWQHEDLLSNMWVNVGEVPGNLVDDDGNGYVDDVHGWDFLAEDGDPRGSTTTPNNANHGTHTAGLLAARTNNATGIASASWNPRLMAVNVSAGYDGYIAFGFDGIVYAVDNGASIVSLSWGGGPYSQAGQDVIDYAVAHGVLVIAAAGNSSSNSPFYPAAYRNVYAVASVQHLAPNTDVISSFSNFGTWVDLAAPGSGIYSTVDGGVNNGYALLSGTSMAAPIAASVAALIKSQHPSWNGAKVGEQLRVTCDNINAVNASYLADMMGNGRVNAFRAVSQSTPAVRLTSWSFADGDGNGQLNRGETVTMSLTAHNYLVGVSNLVLSLTSPTADVSIVDGSETVTIPGDGNVTRSAAFSFTVSPTAYISTQVTLRVGMTAPGYSDFQWVDILIEPYYETLDVNQLQVSLAATGNIGWVGLAGEAGGWKGNGCRFDGGPDCLFEGGLMVGTGPERVSDAVHVPPFETLYEFTDFTPFYMPPPFRLTPGIGSDQEIRMSFEDFPAGIGQPVGLRVTEVGRAYASSPNQGFILLEYHLTNRTAATETGMRVGLYLDWNIDQGHAQTNRVDWDPGRSLGYAWEPSDPALPYLGAMVLQGGTQVTHSAFPVIVFFTGNDKWNALSGLMATSAGPADVCHVLATGPFDVAPGDSIPVWFALVGGHDLAELQANADQARSLWSSVVAVEPVDRSPRAGIALGMPSPNPSDDGARFELSVDRPRHVSVIVCDVRGRRLRTLVNRDFGPGVSSLSWDGRDDRGAQVDSGIYFLRLDSEGDQLARKAVVSR